MSAGYTLFDFGSMVGAKKDLNYRRTAAISEALRKAVTPASVVLDIGTGAGYFAMVAAKLGAAHVYAIEINPVVEMARALVADNGLSHRITIYQDDSNQVELPQRADVIVSDLGGAIPVSGQNLTSLIDAQARHLAQGGCMIPAAASVWAGVVTHPKLYHHMASPWEASPEGLDFRRARAEVLNTPRKGEIPPKALLSEAREWLWLDYYHLKSPHVQGKIVLPILDSGIAHGIALWLEYKLDDEITLSTAPDQPYLPMYGQFFLPWPEPLNLEPGDSIKVDIRARHRAGNYLWSWRTQMLNSEGARRAKFEQASLPALSVVAIGSDDGSPKQRG